MSRLPDVEGAISADEVVQTAEWIASLQLDTGMIPWFPGGHCDPWNHVETAMALDVAGLHPAAERGYEWLVDMQRDDGSWWNYYLPDGTVEEAKLDTNVCAYIATGVWHHWLCTWDRAFVDHLWPTVQRALDWVLSMRRDDGTIIWACTDDDRPWNYSLLTGSSSIAHALRCGASLAALDDEPRPDWLAAADRLCMMINDHPRGPSSRRIVGRWTGTTPCLPVACRRAGQDPPGRRLGRVRDRAPRYPLRQRRAVDHGVGDRRVRDRARRDRRLATATDLVRWTRPHRRRDGAYYTGLVYPGRDPVPGGRGVGVHRRGRDPRRRRHRLRVACQRRVRAALLHLSRVTRTARRRSSRDGVARPPAHRRGTRGSTDDCADSKLSGSSTTETVGLSSSVEVSRSINADASLLVNLPRACRCVRRYSVRAVRKSS